MAITEGIEGNRKPITGAEQGNMVEVIIGRTGRLSLGQPMFNWGARDKYIELKQF